MTPEEVRDKQYTVRLIYSPAGDGCAAPAWLADIVELHGAHSCGNTAQEAVDNVYEAAALWIESMESRGYDVPPPLRGAPYWTVGDEEEEDDDDEEEAAVPDPFSNEALAAKEETADWIRKHGSERLRMALKEELLSSCIEQYVTERLALVRPGWKHVVRNNEWPSTAHPLFFVPKTNPTVEQMKWRRDVRKGDGKGQRFAVPDAELSVARYLCGNSVCLTSSFLGWNIVLFPPKKEE